MSTDKTTATPPAEPAVGARLDAGVRPRAWLITDPAQPDWEGALWHRKPTAEDYKTWGLHENVVTPLYDVSASPAAIMDTRDALGICAPTEADFPAIQALNGRRVALVDLGPNVRVEPDPTARENT